MFTIAGIGKFWARKLVSASACPSSHFLCRDELCLPVYLRCNLVPDCLEGEDEESCETYTCPGYYRCWQSQVCLHLDHLCDGIRQCPYQEDELECKGRSSITHPCPHQCLCHVRAYKCASPFNISSYATLRYLDGASSGMTMADFNTHPYLVYLRLSYCNIQVLTFPNLANLRYLDLGHNNLSIVNLTLFLSFPNLFVLNLTSNPVKHLFAETQKTVFLKSKLNTLDLSRTQLFVLKSGMFENLDNLKQLHLTNMFIWNFEVSTFQPLSKLNLLDMRRSEIHHVPELLLRPLTNLQRLISEDFRICCPTLLPADFNPFFCFAPNDLVSSCNDMFKHKYFEVLMWIYFMISFTGNSLKFFSSIQHLRKSDVGPQELFLLNAYVAGIAMPLYLFLMCIYSIIYQGNFVNTALSGKQALHVQLLFLSTPFPGICSQLLCFCYLYVAVSKLFFLENHHQRTCHFFCVLYRG